MLALIKSGEDDRVFRVRKRGFVDRDLGGKYRDNIIYRVKRMILSYFGSKNFAESGFFFRYG